MFYNRRIHREQAHYGATGRPTGNQGSADSVATVTHSLLPAAHTLVLCVTFSLFLCLILAEPPALEKHSLLSEHLGYDIHSSIQAAWTAVSTPTEAVSYFHHSEIQKPTPAFVPALSHTQQDGLVSEWDGASMNESWLGHPTTLSP